MKVLVIDDEQDIRLVAQVSLRAAGMTVVTAASGAVGVDAARRERPDAILLDVMMPGMDGYETFAALKADADLRGIPVVFLTAKNPSGTESRAHSAGAAGFIAKPFLPLELPTLLKTLLGV
jgi:two-component system alkaline phosphatase synthesis response regulator PhoP